MSENRTHILVVEDDAAARAALARFLACEDFAVVTAETADAARPQLFDRVDLVICDLRLGAASGVDLLRDWKAQRPDTSFILMTGNGDIPSAVEAMKLGAADYLLKPVDPDELLVVMRKELGARQKDARIEELSARLDKHFGFERLVGQSKAMLDVFARVRRAARSESTVLIQGESGTGKELIAEALHQNSPRKTGPFVAVNMAAVPSTLVESELFGHVKGAFTGATGSRVGRFKAAEGGSIFIDEIGDFALELQAKLLRVLETRRVTPVGGDDEMAINARVIAATARNLEQMVADGKFRDDLYYRLSVVTIPLPPLRERAEDIPLLVHSFLNEFRASTNGPPLGVAPELMRYLETYAWPGNVRQVRNCIESMVVLAEHDTLTMADLPATLTQHKSARGNDGPPRMARDTLKSLERSAIEEALERSGGNRTAAARTLGISVRTLQRKLHAWGQADQAPPPPEEPATHVSQSTPP